MKAAGWTGITGAVLGPLLGLAGAWIGMKASLSAAGSEREKRFIVRSTYWMIALMVVFSIALTAILVKGAEFAAYSPTGFTVTIIVLTIGYTAGILIGVVTVNRGLARIRKEDGTHLRTPAETAAAMPTVLKRWQYPARFESKQRLLGLPLLSIRFNGAVESNERKAAIGWIAIGDKAYGILFACGPLAVGGIACGAITAGGIAFGGMAIGVISIGGAAIGGLATGGLAIGHLAFGGCAAAWTAAMGGVSAARDFAVGGIAVAAQANTDVALDYVGNHRFFQITERLMSHTWVWFFLVALSFVPLLWARRIATEIEDD